MIDPRYENGEYDPQEPPSGPYIPDEPGPRPGDPGGTGTVIKQLNPRWNGGSPPATPLPTGPDGKTTHGWIWTGSDPYDPNGQWAQTPGGGMGFGEYNVGYTPPTTPTPPPGGGGPKGGGISGVPQSYRGGGGGGTTASYSGATSPIGGSVPTLADALAAAKQYLPATPEISKPGTFTPPTPVGLDARNRVVEAVLARPEVMDQSFQDALFEQQKEQQAQMAAQARSRLSQTTAARGLSAAGGQELLGQAGVEEGFINNLLAARRDVSTKAAEVNRASSLAAVEMANAVQQGDFARAQAAYETQLKANQIYDQLRLQAAELERGNVALAAQNLLAQREMQLGEQGQSFDQYLRQLQYNELVRQFNEKMAYDYGQFGWNQQMDLARFFG
ncbi:MAG: hypothetical protein EBS05_16855 [Proteobacteria bacterium]|nr:hypothetical protein [Pseudomonadota bacterium]